MPLKSQELALVSRFHEFVNDGGGGKADSHPLLASGQAEAKHDVGLAGATGAKNDDVFATFD